MQQHDQHWQQHDELKKIDDQHMNFNKMMNTNKVSTQ
jgi:hypothetical protein